MNQLIETLTSCFASNIDVLMKKYEGKVIVMSEDMDVKSFDDLATGYQFGVSKYGYGNFLLKECTRQTVNAVHVINPIIAVV